MKYFMDTEFHEYKKQPTVCGLKVGKAIPTIDLISIGIVSEDNREYYAISKDFNIKDAWYSWQPKKHNLPMGTIKEYWLKDNVLKPIFRELVKKENNYIKEAYFRNVYIKNKELKFNFKNLKYLINKYGKTNKQIANEIKSFVFYTGWEVDPPVHHHKLKKKLPINFYAYYADYDWVVFAQLFGKMINLPERFPRYCNDLKQTLEDKTKEQIALIEKDPMRHKNYDLTKFKDYPKQENEHNALNDAIFNRKLYEFLNNL